MKTLLNEVTTMNVDMKERNEMEQVVETAEDWINRVRGAFTAGESATLNNLEQLLSEADDIPVCMEEHQLLVGEIKARRWCTKVTSVLESKTSKLEALQKLLEEFDLSSRWGDRRQELVFIGIGLPRLSFLCVWPHVTAA